MNPWVFCAEGLCSLIELASNSEKPHVFSLPPKNERTKWAFVLAIQAAVFFLRKMGQGKYKL